MKLPTARVSLALLALASPAAGLAIDLPGVQHATGLLRTDYAASEPRSAACFLYADQRTAVTCLHAVANAAHISITFDSGQTDARVKSILRRYDLALLSLDTPIAATPLDPATTAPDAHSHLQAVGFPANLVNATSQRAMLRAIGPTTVEGFVTSPDMRRQLEQQGFPALDAEVLDLESHVEPGMSGGPLVDKQGMVVGICDGGLESGTTELTWAIASPRITDLFASRENLAAVRNGEAPPVLFSSKLSSSAAGEPIVVGKCTFVKLRTARLNQLIESSPAPLHLAFVEKAFAIVDPQEFQFDLYRDERTGATFVVPAGAHAAVEGSTITLYSADHLVRMRIRVYDYENPMQARQEGAAFDYESPMALGELWQNNPQFTYLQPIYYASGLGVYREAMIRFHRGGNYYYPQPVQDMIRFATFAAYHQVMLAGDALRIDLSNFGTGSPTDIAWGKAVMAVELLTFSEQGDVTQAPPQNSDPGF